MYRSPSTQEVISGLIEEAISYEIGSPQPWNIVAKTYFDDTKKCYRAEVMFTAELDENSIVSDLDKVRSIFRDTKQLRDFKGQLRDLVGPDE